MGNSNGTASHDAKLLEFYRSKGASPDTRHVTLEEVNDLRRALGMSEIVGGGSGGASGGAFGGSGGAVSHIGGYDATADYASSAYSKAKETLIRNIAKDIFATMGTRGAENAMTAPLDKVVEHLKKIVPGSGPEFKAEFKGDVKAQHAACKKIAEAINKHHGQIINTNADVNEICQQVSEVMYSLFTGLHTEFIAVSADITRILRNMHIVGDAMDAADKKQAELVAAGGQSALTRQSEGTAALYKDFRKEFDRQIAILGNLINVTISPTHKELVQALSESKDLTALTRGIREVVGTKAFGDKLGHMLSGISTVAHTADLIDKALKKIGMTAAEFRNVKDFGELRRKTFEKLVKSDSGEELDEKMRAAAVIYANNYDHKAISDELAKRGGSEYKGGAAFGIPESETSAGPVYWTKRSLSKKITQKRKIRESILVEFKKNLQAAYNSIVRSSQSIAPKIGKEIPLSDELLKFVTHFAMLPKLDREKLHYALSGWAKDAVSKSQRDSFLDSYRLILNDITPLLQGPGGADFRALHDSIKSMIESIDLFSEKVVKQLTEIHIDSPEKVIQGLSDTAGAFFGSAEGAADGDLNTWATFETIKNTMMYNYKLVNIRQNMARTSGDIMAASPDYNNLLGEYAGDMINKIKRYYTDLIDHTDPSKEYTGPATAVDGSRSREIHASLQAAHKIGAQTNGTAWGVAALQPHETNAKTDAMKVHKHLRDIWYMQMNAKVGMINVAQGVDIYMGHFTEGITRDPDSIKSISKLLEQIDIIAKWFNERSGDTLSFLFEMFPSSLSVAPGTADANTGGGNRAHIAARIVAKYSYGDEDKAPVTDKGLIRLPKGPYYTWLETRRQAGPDHMPGNPFLGRPLIDTTTEQLKGIVELTDKTIKSMRALENILSAFDTVGTKFKDVDLKSKQLMSAGHIFNVLCEYIKMASFTTQFAPVVRGQARPEVTGAVYAGRVNNNVVTLGQDGQVSIPEVKTENMFINATGAGGVVTGAGPHVSYMLANAQNDTLSGENGTGGKLHEIFPSAGFGIPTGVTGSSIVPAAGAVPAVDTEAKAVDNRTGRFKNMSLAMSAIPMDSFERSINFWDYHSNGNDAPRLDAAAWKDDFYDTDLLFVQVIKTIIAKILVMIDTYRLFNRPTKEPMNRYSMGPLRTILGGASGGASIVKIVPAALDLYTQLTLLAEWYRHRFNFENIGQSPLRRQDATDSSYMLSLAPNIDGIWSSFVSVIFDKGARVSEGNYSEAQCQEIIQSINEIYNTYKARDPRVTTRSIINAFILEINRVFGFMRRSDITEYISSRRDMLMKDPTMYENADDSLDYDILNAESQFGAASVPSDRFVEVGLRPKSVKRVAMDRLQKEVDRLKREIDRDFINQYNKPEAVNYKFHETLQNYKKNFEYAKSEKEQYEIVLQMIQGSNKTISISNEKMIMVHEMVAAPLASIYGVYQILKKYNQLIHSTSIHNLALWNAKRAVDGNLARGNPDQITQEYSSALIDEYSEVSGGIRTFIALGIQTYLRGGAAAALAPGARLTIHDLNVEKMARDIIQALLDLQTNQTKLVGVRIGPGGNVNVDFAPLQALCAKTLALVRGNILKLKGMFTGEAELKYMEKFDRLDVKGSLAWLEENLMEILFNDRDHFGLNTANSKHLPFTLARLAVPGGTDATAITRDSGFPSLDNVFREIVYYGYRAGQSSLPRVTTPANTSRFPFNVIANKHDPSTPGEKKAFVALSGDDPTGVETGNTKFLRAASVYFESKHTINTINPGAIIKEFKDGNVVDIDGGAADIETGTMNSLMMRYNKIMHMFVLMGMDEGSNKTYGPLLESIMAADAAKEIVQGEAFPNVGSVLYQVVGAHGAASELQLNTANLPTAIASPLRSPETASLLFASTALAIRGIMTTQMILGPVQKRKHLYDNLQEVPTFLKERLRVNLPIFAKLFQYIIERAVLIKDFLAYSDIKNNIASIANAGEAEIVNTDSSYSSKLRATANDDSATRAAYFSAMLTKLIGLATSAQRSATAVYKELDDKLPYFLETTKDFISDYKNRNGELPLIPASMMLIPAASTMINPARQTTSDVSQLLLPVSANGSDAYKLNHGLRSVFNDPQSKYNRELFPSSKDIYNAYSNYASTANKISVAEFDDTTDSLMMASRFIGEGTIESRLFASRAPIAQRLVTPSVFSFEWDAGHLRDLTNPSPDEKTSLPVMALSKHAILSELIELIESYNLKSSKDKLARFMGLTLGATLGAQRDTLRIHNIIYLDVVPLNVHAFMREVPFTNLNNYAYTHDRMMQQDILPDSLRGRTDLTPDTVILRADAATSSTRELMLKLLCHPFAFLNHNEGEYYALTASLFNGNDGTNMGRPRYLSDQLFHKALLTSSVQLGNMAQVGVFPGARMSLQEGGPSAYEAQRAVLHFNAPEQKQRNRENPSVAGFIRRAVLKRYKNTQLVAGPAIRLTSPLVQAAGAVPNVIVPIGAMAPASQGLFNNAFNAVESRNDIARAILNNVGLRAYSAANINFATNANIRRLLGSLKYGDRKDTQLAEIKESYLTDSPEVKKFVDDGLNAVNVMEALSGRAAMTDQKYTVEPHGLAMIMYDMINEISTIDLSSAPNAIGAYADPGDLVGGKLVTDNKWALMKPIVDRIIQGDHPTYRAYRFVNEINEHILPAPVFNAAAAGDGVVDAMNNAYSAILADAVIAAMNAEIILHEAVIAGGPPAAGAGAIIANPADLRAHINRAISGAGAGAIEFTLAGGAGHTYFSLALAAAIATNVALAGVGLGTLGVPGAPAVAAAVAHFRNALTEAALRLVIGPIVTSWAAEHKLRLSQALARALTSGYMFSGTADQKNAAIEQAVTSANGVIGAGRRVDVTRAAAMTAADVAGGAAGMLAAVNNNHPIAFAYLNSVSGLVRTAFERGSMVRSLLRKQINPSASDMSDELVDILAQVSAHCGSAEAKAERSFIIDEFGDDHTAESSAEYKTVIADFQAVMAGYMRVQDNGSVDAVAAAIPAPFNLPPQLAIDAADVRVPATINVNLIEVARRIKELYNSVPAIDYLSRHVPAGVDQKTKASIISGYRATIDGILRDAHAESMAAAGGTLINRATAFRDHISTIAIAALGGAALDNARINSGVGYIPRRGVGFSISSDTHRYFRMSVIRKLFNTLKSGNMSKSLEMKYHLGLPRLIGGIVHGINLNGDRRNPAGALVGAGDGYAVGYSEGVRYNEDIISNNEFKVRYDDSAVFALAMSHAFAEPASNPERVFPIPGPDARVGVGRNGADNALGLLGHIRLRLHYFYNSPFALLNTLSDLPLRDNRIESRAALTLADHPVSTRGMKIYDPVTKRWKTANPDGTNPMGAGDVIYNAEIGKARFDTKLVRMLSWIAHAQRFVRFKLIQHLAVMNTPVIKGLAIAAPKVTEYANNDHYDDADYDGTSYEGYA